MYEHARGTGPRERAKDRAEARQFLESRRGQVAEGRYVGCKADRVTFDELVALVVDDYKTNDKKTWRTWSGASRSTCAPSLVASGAQAISAADVRAFIARERARALRWRSEIASLTWAQVDLEEGTVRLEPGSTKNRDGRLIFLPGRACAVVEEQWHERQAQWPTARTSSTVAVAASAISRGAWDG